MIMPTIAQVKQQIDRIWYASFQTDLADTLASQLRRHALAGVKAALETALVEELEAHRQRADHDQRASYVFPKIHSGWPCLRNMLLILIILGNIAACGAEQTSVRPATIPTANSGPQLSPSPQPETPSKSDVAGVILPTPMDNKPQPSSGWTHRWLQGISCQAPCWEGITPGKTSATDALEALNRNPLTSNLRIYPRTTAGEDGLVDWIWVANTEVGGGSFAYKRNTALPIVSQLIAVFPTTFHLREIIAAYGEPSHIIPSVAIFQDPHSPQAAKTYNLVVVYLSRGFYLTIGKPQIAKPAIAPDLELHGRVTFFVPTTAGLDTVAPPGWWDSTDLVPWQGFHDFDWYCQQAQASPHKVCG
jgi:hypothetical protein